MIKKYFGIIKVTFSCCLMNEMEYRLNFVLRATIEFSYLLMSVILFNIIYMNVDSIAGWSHNEMLLLVLITNLLDSVLTMLFNVGLSSIPQMINDGTLDFLLLKPINKRFYISFRKFELSQIINLAMNFMFSAYVISQMNIELSVGKIAFFILLFIISILIMYNIYFFIMIISFWTVKIDTGVSIFYQLFNVGNKPMEIFDNKIRKIFIYVVPIFVAFNYPIKYLMGKFDIKMLLVSFFTAMMLTIITQIFFKAALKKYSSVGC